MGGGTYRHSLAETRSTMRGLAGDDGFEHHKRARRGEVAALHPDLDFRIKKVRESRDCDDKGPAVPIAVMIDITGSMRSVPKELLKDMHRFMRVIVEGKVVDDPQILFGGIGDAMCDQVPIQLGEFEADDQKADDCLSHIYLEGGGGGNVHESYDLVLYTFAKHVETDAFEKRSEKGFLFIIGDEGVSPRILATEVKDHLGVDLSETMTTSTDSASQQVYVPVEDVMDELQSKFHVFLLRPGGTNCFNDMQMKGTWLNILSAERVIDVADWERLLPLMAGIVTKMSTAVPVEAIMTSLEEAGFTEAGLSGTSEVLNKISAGVS